MDLKRMIELEMGNISKERDTLTKIPNREYMEHYAARLLNHAKEKRQPFTFYLIDIDNFKNINDSYSHDDGDLVLQNIAETLGTILYEHSVPSRWGGEEFVVVGLDGQEKAKRIAGEIVDNLSISCAGAHCKRANGQEEDITVSVGYATHHPDDELMEENGHSARSTILKSLRGKADRALFYSKFNGRNQANAFDDSLNANWTEAKTFRRYLAGLVDQYVDNGKLVDPNRFPKNMTDIDFDGVITKDFTNIEGEKVKEWTDVGNMIYNSLSLIKQENKTKDSRFISDQADNIYRKIMQENPDYVGFDLPQFNPSGPVLTK